MTSPGGRYISYAGKKPPLDQAQRRVNLKLEDQHGRIVHIVWDKVSQGEVGKYPQFTAPWVPNMKFLHIHAENGFPTGVEWVYDVKPSGWQGESLLESTRAAWQMFYENLLRYAGKMPGVDAMTAYQAALDRRWQDVPKALLKEVGITPEPEEYIKAAMAGNRWILGFTSVVPAWAGPFLAYQERMRAELGKVVTEDELDRYRDADGSDELEEEFDAEGLGGKRVPVAAAKTPNTRTTRIGRPPKHDPPEG